MKWDLKFKTNLLLGLFVAALIAANLIGTKITNIWFVEFSVGIFAFPITFLITDIIEEVHGKKKTKEFIYIGFFALVFVLLITALSVSLPFAERSFVQSEYTKVFGTTLRIFVASIIAFLISQLHDVWAFNFWKKKTKGKFLWLRNNLSTVASQFIDTTIFMFIAFYAVSPKFTVEYIFALIIPYWILKIIIALFDTPLVYLGVWWLKKKA
ncbi:queuosine precursor transporter [Candidatus Woesearchaeota archaeon]|nr:queuosine precursor transporter [Candidatus Woesearchaeota archaeon]